MNITRDQITLHPNETNNENDIAVIVLPTHIVFSAKVGQVEMVDRNDHLMVRGAKVIILEHTIPTLVDQNIHEGTHDKLIRLSRILTNV